MPRPAKNAARTNETQGELLTEASPKKAVRRIDHHAVVSLKVTGGFLGGAFLELADGLNCFIGGRGAGKTTALELLRFGLGLMPDPRTSPQRHRTIDTLVKSNLGNGRLEVELRTKTGMKYTAGRGANESVQVLNESGQPVPVSLDRDLIFSADVFSQNEIEEMASSPTAQLALFDRFQEEESLTIARELDAALRQLEQSSIDLRRLDQELEDLRSKASELPALEERLKGLAEIGGPDAEKMNVAHLAKTLRAREAQVAALLTAATQKVVRESSAIAASFQSTLEAQLDTALVEGPNKDLFQSIKNDVQSFERKLLDASATIAKAAADLEKRIAVQEGLLRERHATQEAEYRAMMSESEEHGGRAAERTTLQNAHAVALSAAKEQKAKEKQRKAAATARAEVLKKVSELRDRRFALRKRVAERLTAEFPSLRVTVAQAAELEPYRNLIAEALKGAGMKQGVVAERLSQAFLPAELAQIVATKDEESLVARGGVDQERARRIIDALGASGMAYLIDTVDLQDRPCIELLDGEKYKESSNLSTGQRCTTILPILLLQSERPLLIDQPEDNLDNAFVYETIVKALRTVKGGRQVIFVTHNPNIPVLGEAERVFVFESDGQHATVRKTGTVDECKDDIERILEGGREAFLQRKKRYGH